MGSQYFVQNGGHILLGGQDDIQLLEGHVAQVAVRHVEADSNQEGNQLGIGRVQQPAVVSDTAPQFFFIFMVEEK